MNKKILTICAIASIAAAVFSCSKKDDDKETTTTSTTSTTATTSTTTPPPPAKKYPTPGSNQLAIDTNLVDFGVDNCALINQGRYSLTASMSGAIDNKFTATFGKSPNFSNEFTVTKDLPVINSSTQIQLVTRLDNVDFIAQSGKVKYFKNTDSSGIQFTKLNFKGANDSVLVMSGFLKCP